MSLDDPTKNEIEHRIAVGWKTFWAMSKLLLNQGISRRKRLEIFDTTVAASVLYGTESWTPRVEEFCTLESARRSMLRRIVGVDRKPDETWVEWITRTTRHAEDHLNRAGLDDWVTAVKKKKWRWAGHLARRCDGRWSHKILAWEPSKGYRIRGRPCKRWRDELDTYFTTQGLEKDCWIMIAQDRDTWASMETDFVRNF